MAKTLIGKSRSFQQSSPPRKKTYTQTVCIALGCVMIVLGLSGILNPEFMGMHLGPMHSLVLTTTGVLSIWSAGLEDRRKAFFICLGLGIFYALHAIAGFLLGSPGTPQVGYEARDALLIRIAPGFIELATVDHIVHALLSIFFFSGAISWKKRQKQALR